MVPIDQRLSNFLLCKDLKIIDHWFLGNFQTFLKVEKKPEFEVCPKCATKSSSVHDRRWVKIKDAPIRGTGIQLQIRKIGICLLYTSPSPRDQRGSRMPSSA